MANRWGTNPKLIDTAGTDTTYDATHDTKNGGTQYSTQQHRITMIRLEGDVATNQVILQECTPDASVDNGADFFNHIVATGQLHRDFYFIPPLVVAGIYPKTLGGSTKVYIYGQ